MKEELPKVDKQLDLDFNKPTGEARGLKSNPKPEKKFVPISPQEREDDQPRFGH